MVKADFHLHTVYCDGENTPTQLAQAAFAAGFSAIGFSGHSYTPFDTSYCMTPEKTVLYYREIEALKAAYKGRLQIYCGIEQELFAPSPAYAFDYLIGSVHYLSLGSSYYPIDESPEQTSVLALDFFHGDYDALCECYFSHVAQLAEAVHPDIIGHFDLITKFDRVLPIRCSERYMKAATDAADALLSAGAVFELNTGAMAGGIQTKPYPGREILQYLAAHGARLVLSSDSHCAKTLGYAFAEARRLAIGCGFPDERILPCPSCLSLQP